MKKLTAIILAFVCLALPACAPTELPEATTDSTTAAQTSEEALTTLPEETTSAPEPQIDYASLPRTVYGGAWDTSHVQGFAIDDKCEYMYFSFTTKLVKTDMQGNIIGSVDNLPGHLGDLDYNPEDGRVYGSFEMKTAKSFYIAIFDCDKIDREGMNMMSDVMTVVPMMEVIADFTATSGGRQYRYGCAGMDGVAFGPDFGADPDSPTRLMVAYGIFQDNGREDNDYQIIVSYDWREFAEYEKKLSPTVAKDGPKIENKYFIYTGNTNWGIQNLEYDPASGLWFMAVYRGSKPQFPNYSLFAVDGAKAPHEGDIVGQPTPERGLLLDLAELGQRHDASGIRGWYFGKPDTGIQSIGGGYFYISHRGNPDGKQDCTATLYKWVGGETNAFEIVE